MRRQTAAACTLTLVAACGMGEVHDAQPTRVRARTVQTWDVGEGLAERKRVVVDTCRQAGKGDDITAILLAVIMGETNTCKSCDRDQTKDSQGDARNISAYNLNVAYLKAIGFDPGRIESLNDDANLGEATRAVLTGIDKFGVDGFLNFHRGGATGMADGCSYGCAAFRAHIHDVQAYLLQHRELFTSGQRVGGYMQHV